MLGRRLIVSNVPIYPRCLSVGLGTTQWRQILYGPGVSGCCERSPCQRHCVSVSFFLPSVETQRSSSPFETTLVNVETHLVPLSSYSPPPKTIHIRMFHIQVTCISHPHCPGAHIAWPRSKRATPAASGAVVRKFMRSRSG